jgi:hypothetical protein
MTPVMARGAVIDAAQRRGHAARRAASSHKQITGKN